jgi:hypothetical protein
VPDRNALVSWALLWWGLALARVPRQRRLPSVLWTPLVWDALLLSQFPYYGFLFVPIESLGAALFLRRRAGLSRVEACWLGVAVRLLSLGLTYAARPAAHLLVPWPG